MDTTPPAMPRPFTLRRALLVVLFAAFAVRLLFGASLPILLSNDSLDYAATAIRIASGEPANFSPVRTPGYPILLAIAFLLLGTSGVAVLLLHHLLGLGIALLATFAAARFVRPAFACVIGILVAFDPFLLGFSHLMLSEVAAAFFVMLAVAAAVYADRSAFWAVMIASIGLAAACLVRPAMQVVVPFVVLGMVGMSGLSFKQRLRVAALVLLGFLGVSGTWLVHNANRGVKGFGEGFGWALWVSLVQQDLYDRDYVVPEPVREATAKLTAAKDGGNYVWTYLAEPSVAAQPRAFFREWAVASIRKQPAAYAQRVGWAFLWQLNCFPKGSPQSWEQTRIFFKRITMDNSSGGGGPPRPSNFMTTSAPAQVLPLGMSGKDGLVRSAWAWWCDHHPTGLPQVPLCLLAIAGGIAAILKRHWLMVGLYLGTGAVVAVHAAMVFFQSRYSLPAWLAWYPLAAYPLSLLGAWWHARPNRNEPRP
ncbi:MAG: hypothetical protein HBSAPP03_03520 [Phycisphaerae bacterium]|nr:MAG: hypothetical protein HBSAPP03_03520 [Phycisphaerae bacterium]